MDNSVPQELLDAGRGYEALYVKALFQTWTKHVIDGASVSAGDHVLDIACGTGVLTRNVLQTVGASGRVVGADVAPGMLAAAKEIEPVIEWVEAPAEALPFKDASFERIVSQFGMMFFTDRQKSAHEMFRVLKPDGTLAIAVWNSVAENPAYKEVIAILDDEISKDAGNALRLPFSLGDCAEIPPLLEKAGFKNIRVQTRQEDAHFPSASQMVEAELRGWLPLFDIMLDEPAIERVLATADARLAQYKASDGTVRFPTSAHIVTAHKN